MALDKALTEQNKKDEPLIKAGRSPGSWRLPQVVPFDELPPEHQVALINARAARRTPFPSDPPNADHAPGVADA